MDTLIVILSVAYLKTIINVAVSLHFTILNKTRVESCNI